MASLALTELDLQIAEIPADKLTKWGEHGVCNQVGQDIFMPNPTWPRDEYLDAQRAAKEICSTCPVKSQCLDYALNQENPPVGIWGGTTESDRRELSRKRPLRRIS